LGVRVPRVLPAAPGARSREAEFFEEAVTHVFRVHKPGQAKLSRTLALLGGLLLVVWGCWSLVLELSSFHPLDRAWNELLMDAPPARAWAVDLVVLETKFSPASSIAALVMVAASIWWFWMLNRPRVADRLIDMEAELRKVSWPTFSDAWQSTLVVSGFTALIVVLVFSYDLVIRFFIETLPVRRI
jgi:preprotein translocase SecE subunit